MKDLLSSQIRDSCRLSLPEGLKDLMSDISREVLRAQPENLYQFIADYLSVLLVTREHLFIASRVCDDVCKNRCSEELEDELRALSLSEEDVAKCLDIIAKYFSSGEVKEGNLLQKLVRETDIGQDDLHAIQDAVRRAFLRHRLNSTASIESSTDGELDETMIAAKHTLKIYKKATENSDINYDCVASKIQAAYRAYNVHSQRRGHKDSHSRKEDANEKVRFHNKKEHVAADCIHAKRCASKCSSVSLAGSFLSLPLYNPYSIGQPSDIVEADEVGEKEKERSNFDYITNRLNEERKANRFREPEIKGKKTISFHNLLEIVEPVEYDNEVCDEIDEASYESDEVYEDVINEATADDENTDRDDVIQEHIISARDEIVKPGTVLMELKGETGSNLSEDDDQVQENEMKRITQTWIDNDAQENIDEIEMESVVVSPNDDDESEQVIDSGGERRLTARNDDDDAVIDEDVDDWEISSLKSV